MNKTFAVAFVSLILALMCAVLGWSFAGAASNSDARADACHTYHTFSHQKDVEVQAETDGVHCGQGSIAPTTAANSLITPTPSVCYEDMPCWDCSTMGNHICGPIVTPTPVTPEPAQPVVTPSPEKVEKVHCNKGEGNGSEGCDPGNHPELGNNDEDNANNGPDNSNKGNSKNK